MHIDSLAAQDFAPGREVVKPPWQTACLQKLRMKAMSRTSFALLIALGATAAPQSQAITLGFSSIDEANAKLIFNGTTDTFSFGTALTGTGTGYSFSLTESDGAGDAIGLFGTIEGTFSIGTVVNGEAPVSGTGKVIIEGGFIADVTFDNLFKTRATGGIEGAFNLSNIIYSGLNADLLALKAGAPGDANLSFTITGKTLSQIVESTTPISTSYDGEFYAQATSVPDGGATALFLGMGVISLAGMFRKRS